MLITLVRTIILYVVVIAAVRLMGKRQIGELQPTELVITILLSEIAAIPLQNNETPLLNSVAAVALLVALSVFASVIGMKSVGFRKLLEGKPLIIIRDGKLDQTAIKQLRFTVADLLSALRQKDIFDLEAVQYAIVETNGSISILPKPENKNLTSGMLNLTLPDNGMPILVISDGKLIKPSLRELELKKADIKSLLSKKGTDIQSVLLLIMDKQGVDTLIVKDENI